MMALMYLPLGVDLRLVAPLLLVVSTVAQVWAGATFYRAAWAAAKLGVAGLPTLILFEDGRPVERLVGFRTKAAPLDAVRPHLDGPTGRAT